MIVKKTLLEAKEDKQKFIDKFGEEEFNTFWNNKQKLKNMGISVDILYHVKNTSVDEMKDILTKVQETKSKNQKIKADKTGAVLLYSDDTWKVYRIDSYDAAKYYGKGTVWCISGNYPGHEGRGQYYFDHYLDDSGYDYLRYYFFIKNDGQKWRVCQHKSNPEEADVWDSQDGRPSSIEGAPAVEGVPFVGTEPFKVKNGVLVGIRPNEVRRLVLGTNVLTIPDEVKVIGKFSFLDKSLPINRINFNNVEEIRNGAFVNFRSYSTGLSFDLSGVSKLGAGAFYNSEVTKVNLGNKLVSIPTLAFADCDELNAVIMGSSISEIDDRAFEGIDKNKVKFLVKEGSYAESWLREHGFSNIRLVDAEGVGIE